MNMSCVPAFFPVLYHDVSQKMELPNSGSLRLATVPCMVATLTTVKIATKIMRPRSDRGGAQTNIEAKRPRIEHY